MGRDLSSGCRGFENNPPDMGGNPTGAWRSLLSVVTPQPFIVGVYRASPAFARKPRPSGGEEGPGRIAHTFPGQASAGFADVVAV
jgi:hypothetical protein